MVFKCHRFFLVYYCVNIDNLLRSMRLQDKEFHLRLYLYLMFKIILKSHKYIKMEEIQVNKRVLYFLFFFAR